ncbi:GlsB/YeaQ/YmgE family stress response membrane protein [Xylanibacter muris]|uniref:GlsB/YeaQ/YmgE family stress response membrane protein n=1 Tax=Xylanibacter muris TaxID=2736290 RepID=A0ABX2AL60_9BACT|nr:GlsB/YeaQ/YmgE family stress response membrane protein [Xylanibacter muris]NPD90925.1 GlsB/YeaQ/YmgE family stress response membrane protein [Xylanibacter muris]
MTGLIGSIIIGILAGFLAGKIMRGGGYGCLINLILGIVGGAFGGWIFNAVGINWGGTIGQLVTAVVGAISILFIASLFKKS